MMTQEEFMDVMAMKRQGMSIKEIAEETGYHPSTISGWLRNGGPGRTAAEDHGRGDRRVLGGRDRRIVARRTAPVGHQRLRVDQSARLHRLLCQRGPAPQHAARPEVRGRPGGLDADRDCTG